MKKLIFIQLNEINFDILKKYSKLKKFKFFNENVLRNLNITISESEYKNLEPWIQWVSINTGLTASEHKIFRLGDIQDSDLKQIYEIIESKGYKVGAICPMNVKNNLKNTNYFIPDPWTKTSKPKKFLQNIIYTTFSESVNDNSKNKLSVKNKIILTFLSLYFFRGKKLFKFIKYYFKSIKFKWYRAIIFDYLLHEIHISFLKKFKKDFSTIFFNAGAHIQHHYLHNSWILKDQVDKNPSWYVEDHQDPILDVYSFYDEILSDYLNKNYSILIATGLTQNPFIEKEYYYRLKDHHSFIKNLDINFKAIYPRMSRDFLISFNTQEDCLKASEIFKKINIINDIKFFDIDIRQSSLFVIFCFNKNIKENLKMKIPNSDSINLYNAVSFVALKNGKHDQKGYLISLGEFQNYMPAKNSHVKELFNSINNYFNKK
jgi:hypothetical protein